MWSGFIRQNEEALRRVQGERLGKDMTKRQKKSLTRIIIAAVLMMHIEVPACRRVAEVRTLYDSVSGYRI